MKILNSAIVRTLPFVPRPLVRVFSSRYVAGETLDEALAVVRRLNTEGCMATLDVLGEDVVRLEETEETVAEYAKALDAIARERLDSNISVKLSALGLKLDPVECRRQFSRILEAAARHGSFVRIDMEDSSVTEETIRVFLEARERTERVGIVIQAYLRRSRSDVTRLIAASANVRVCKGIYAEPPDIAFQDPNEIRDSYSALVEGLLGAGCYVGIATHDPALVDRALATVASRKLSRGEYEFQMLLGVAPDLRRRLVTSGHRLRVYIPYGRSWYGYSMRRLKENPAIAGHIVKNLFTGGGS
ncbi:MAG: proline dehydrogenase family protein [Acidobacteriota bacterium]